MIRVELLALDLIMEAWFVRFTLQEAETILHLTLCGNIDVSISFRTRHLGLNFFLIFSSFAGFAAYSY